MRADAGSNAAPATEPESRPGAPRRGAPRPLPRRKRRRSPLFRLARPHRGHRLARIRRRKEPHADLPEQPLRRAPVPHRRPGPDGGRRCVGRVAPDLQPDPRPAACSAGARRERRGRSRDGPLRRQARPAGRPAVHRPQRRADCGPRGRAARPDRRSPGGQHRRRSSPRSRGFGRALGRRGRRGLRRRPGAAVGLLSRRRRGRLLARRRHGLARPQARPADERPDGHRDRDRRRRAAPRRSRQRGRPVLGRARRRRQLRRCHGARVRAVPRPRDLRRLAVLPVRARLGRDARVARVRVRRPAGRDHHCGAGHAVPADGGDPGDGAREVVHHSPGRLPRQRGGRCGADPPAHRSRSRS